jgi:magnesium-transporting ATPase (P-type)
VCVNALGRLAKPEEMSEAALFPLIAMPRSSQRTCFSPRGSDRSLRNAMETTGRANVKSWHALDSASVLATFQVDPASGLSETEASERLARYGANRLREEKTESIWQTFLEEVREPMIVLLLVTGTLYAIWGELPDALTIFAVIFILVAVEVVNERRAKRAISALSKLAEPTTLARRGGRVAEARADRIVPGDIIMLQAGRRVAADARLVEAFGLAVDESSLTGESVSVSKDAAATLLADTALAERTNMVYAGTTVVRGRGTAVVVATGMEAELGRVAGIAREVEAPRTTLQKAMGQLSKYLAWVAIGFSILVPLLGVLIAGQPVRQMLLTGLSLAFSVIPEEIPIIITMVLGLGAYRLAQQHAIVKRLQTVENLGDVTVIASDKTGTLTENRMEVSRLYPERSASRLLEIGVLCNDASDVDATAGQDPLDVALLRAAREAKMDSGALRRRWRMRSEFTFDNTRKRMSIVYESDGLRVVVKGAPEAVLAGSLSHRIDERESPIAEADRQSFLATAEDMARQGLRVIGLAEKTVTVVPTDAAQAESGLTFVGLVGFIDPPRQGVKQTVPFAPVQIILMELFMDLAASAAFVAEPPEAGLMNRPPRDPQAPFIDHAMVTGIFASAAGLFGAVSVAYLVTWYDSHDLVRAQTMAFVTWLLGHVFLALNMRSEHEPIIRVGLFSNRVMVAWGVATAVCVVAMTSVPAIGALLKVTPLSGPQWTLATGAAIVGTFWQEAGKFYSWSRSAQALPQGSRP